MSWSAPHTFSVGEEVTAAIMNTHLRDNMNAVAAVGDVKVLKGTYAGGAAETTILGGWLQTNGAAVSRATYSALFGVIGTTFGVGNGTTTFNVPNVTAPFTNGIYAIKY